MGSRWLARRQVAKLRFDLLPASRWLKIANRHNNGVVGHVMSLVMAIQIIARHGGQIGQIANDFMMIRMHPKRGGRSVPQFSWKAGSFSYICRSDMMTVRSDSTSSGVMSGVHHAVGF